MDKLKTPLQHMIFGVLARYVNDFPGETITRWDCVNFLIGYYGAITADHIEAIMAVIREGVVVE